MDWFSKNKGKKSPGTRGLIDNHPHPTTSQSSIPVSNYVPSPVTSAPAPYNPPFAIPYESPQQAGDRGPAEISFFAGGNENTGGEQEIDEVEIGNSANGAISPLFGNNGGKFDIKVGNNKNGGVKQTIGKVKFGNAG